MVCLLFAAPALAQHPCDQPSPTSVTIQSGAPHKILWCSQASENIEAFVAYVDGQVFDLLPVIARTGPNAGGWVQYETSLFLQVTRGDHVLEAATYNRDLLTKQLQVGLKSPPFFFAAVDTTPLTTAPVIKGVSR